MAERLQRGEALAHAPGARLLYVSEADGGATLYAGGVAYTLEPALAPLAPLLTDAPVLPARALIPHLATPDAPDLLAALLTDGVLTWRS